MPLFVEFGSQGSKRAKKVRGAHVTNPGVSLLIYELVITVKVEPTRRR